VTGSRERDWLAYWTGPRRPGHPARLGSGPEQGMSLAGYRLSGGRRDFPETASWIGEVIARQLGRFVRRSHSSAGACHTGCGESPTASHARLAAYLIEDDTMEDPRCKHG
jgi:hypothetical protein